MIFYRPIFKKHPQPLVHVFVSNTKYIMKPDDSVHSVDSRTFEEYRRIYTNIKPWQCIAPKELGVWSDEDSSS